MTDTIIASTEIHELAEQMRSAMMKSQLRPTVYVYTPSNSNPLYQLAVESRYGGLSLTEVDHLELMQICSDLEDDYVALHGIEGTVNIEEEGVPPTDPIPITA